MNKNRFFMLPGLIVAFFQVLYLYSNEYIYPLATYTDSGHEILLFAHQNGDQQIGLWSFNKTTQGYEQLVASRYNPVGVTLLPDKSGFSFLDNGLIRVKYFLKRSPQTIEIYDPIYNIGSVSWLDNATCLFHAKKGNRYGMYTTDLDGQCATIIESKSYDYLYPCMVNNKLFYIERDPRDNHSIKSMTLRNFLLSFGNEDAQMVSDFGGDKTIVKLMMRNEREGFAIEHPSVINQNDPVMTFGFYRFISDAQGAWQTKKLFTFSLPTYLFFGSAHAMRDPMPALFPLVTPNSIYFISLEPNQKTISLYCYDERTGSTTLCNSDGSFVRQYSAHVGLPHDDHGYILMPRVVNSILINGYSLNQ